MIYEEAKSCLERGSKFIRRPSWSEDESITLNSVGDDGPQFYFNHEIEPDSDELCGCLIENDDELGQDNLEADDWQVSD